MAAADHYFLKQAAAVVQQELGVPLPNAGEQLAMLGLLRTDLTTAQSVITQQAGIINQQSTVIQQLNTTLTALQNAIPGQITDALTAYNTSVVAPIVTQLAGAATAASVTALTTTVNGKASAADLTTLQGTVTSNTAAIATKATTASVTALSTVVDGKASIASVTAAATTAAQGVSDAATQKGRVDTLVNTTIPALATATDLNTQKTRVDGLVNTTVPALQTDISSRLLRAGDIATGSLMVPQATAAAAAPRLDQTYGGLNAPIRFVTAVGATATAMGPGPLTDPTPQGRKAKPYFVVLTMRSAPTVGATITVSTTQNGTGDVFTKTYLLAALPGLNAILAPMQPVFIELPAGTTLWAKATAGTWDVEVLSYYKA